MTNDATEAACNMKQQEPYDFAWCETHDETFPFGAVCSVYRGVLERRAIAAVTHRECLEALAQDEWARNQ